MSWLTERDRRDAPPPPDRPPEAPLVVNPSSKDLGGFSVRRALPSVQRRMVGSFVFLDHMGPATFHAGDGLDVRPHPHIGLATVTYLTEGAIQHRDTLGTDQAILPGDVNWMVAGRGIAHSERSDATGRQIARRMQGIQSWVALPRAHEETAPAFIHHAGSALPRLTDTGVSVVVIAGTAYGAASPVPVFSHTLYADAALDAGVRLPLPDEHAERAVYVMDGAVEVAGDIFDAGTLLVFRPGDAMTLVAARACRLLLVGGEPLDGPRHLWWNFVSSSLERIEQAKRDWQAGRFGLVPGDSREFIPLPA